MGLWAFVCFLIQLAFLVIMIVAMIKAFTGVRWDIPFVGPLARKQMGETETVTSRFFLFPLSAPACQSTATPQYNSLLTNLLRKKLHHDLRQHQFMIELAGDQTQISLEAGVQAGDELGRLESMRLLRRKGKLVATDRAIFFSR